jgi:hypothetical protein
MTRLRISLRRSSMARLLAIPTGIANAHRAIEKLLKTEIARVVPVNS